MPDSENDLGLVFAEQLNGDGCSTTISWKEIKHWKPSDKPIWIHLDRSHENTEKWLREESGLTQATVDALLAEESRPRVFKGKQGTVAILRGVNLNPGENVEDMIDLRIWSEGLRLITLRKTRLQSVRDVRAELTEKQEGAESIPALFQELVLKLSQRKSETIESFKPRIDEIEAELDLSDAQVSSHVLMDLRNQAISLRRYLAPQRIALSELMNNPPDWADKNWYPRMREVADTLTYYVEELDFAKEQAIVIKDDIASQLSETTNRTLYALAVISGVFLPLAFLTGLLGINVGGMPGTGNTYAFWVVCGILAAVCVFEIVLFKKLKWI